MDEWEYIGEYQLSTLKSITRMFPLSVLGWRMASHAGLVQLERIYAQLFRSLSSPCGTEQRLRAQWKGVNQRLLYYLMRDNKLKAMG